MAADEGDEARGRDTDEKREQVGRQAADQVRSVVETDDCPGRSVTDADGGVTFTQESEVVPWGVNATFEDLYGNRFDVVEPAER